MTDTLSKLLAKRIINQLGSTGTPPAFGLEHFTVGLDGYLNLLLEEYLEGFVRDGGSAFKLVKGIYGGGKTHFLYSLRSMAWKGGYVVAYVPLSKADGSPFYALGKVFEGIVANLTAPITSDEESMLGTPGIESLLKIWYQRKLTELQESGLPDSDARDVIEGIANGIDDLPSSSLRNALVHGVKALVNSDDQTFERLSQWMKGQLPPDLPLKRMGIAEKIDDASAFRMLRSLVKATRSLGFTGLVILFDEAEQSPTLGVKFKEKLLNNLRALIDACGESTFAGAMVFYAVPDLNFLDGTSAIYEALKQRLSTVFKEVNPTGVRIDLDEGLAPDSDLEASRLNQLIDMGRRIGRVYDVAYGSAVSESAEDIITEKAKEAIKERFGDSGYKREFVKDWVAALHELKAQQKQTEAGLQ